MKRYTYSRSIKTPEGNETFTADQFDSFDEAISAVNKGIYERELFLAEKAKKATVANLPVENEDSKKDPAETVQVPGTLNQSSNSTAGQVGGAPSTTGGASA